MPTPTLLDAISHFNGLTVKDLGRDAQGQMLMDDVLRYRMPFMMCDSQSKVGCWILVKKLTKHNAEFNVYNPTVELIWECEVCKVNDALYIKKGPFPAGDILLVMSDGSKVTTPKRPPTEHGADQPPEHWCN